MKSKTVEVLRIHIFTTIFCSLLIGFLIGGGIFLVVLNTKMNLFELNQKCSAKVFGVCEANSGEPYLMCSHVTRLWDNQWDCETQSVTNVNHVLISYSKEQVQEMNKDFNVWCRNNNYEMICQSQSENGVDIIG